MRRRGHAEPCRVQAVTGDPALPDAEVVDKTIEDRAVRFVIDQELRLGREARDTRRQPGAADVASGDRIIEIKASSGWAVRKNGLLYVTGPQLRRARSRDELTPTEQTDQSPPRVTLQHALTRYALSGRKQRARAG